MEPDRDSCLSEVYLRERAGLVRLAAFVTGDVGAADELVQDAFADLHETRTEVERPGAWLQKAVARRSVSWVRRRTTATHYLDSIRPDVQAVTPDVPARLRVREAVRRLTPERRAVVFCRYYLDLSEASTAEVLGIRPGTAKSRLARALRELKGALDDD